MSVTANYKQKTLTVTVSKTDLEAALVNGYVTGAVSLGKIPTDAGNITLTLSLQAQSVLKEIYNAEQEVLKPKAQKLPTDNKPQEGDQNNGKD